MPEKKTKPPTDELDDDIFAIRVRVTSQQVHDLLGRGGLDFGDRPHVSEGPDGQGRLDLFVSRAQIETLRGDGYEVEIASNQSARHRERLGEVGQGDRFDGGRIPPRGLGRKIGGRGQPGQRPPSVAGDEQEPRS